ncbi:MAG: hypothetical protein H6714_03995 [Myxococcales bacterium]|nr:hypothetical protein [Myxococcales bacterium]
MVALPLLAEDVDGAVQEKTEARAAYIHGQRLAQQGDIDAAMQAIRHSYALYPAAGSLYALGLLHERVDEIAEAIRLYHRALRAPHCQALSKSR